MGANDSIVNEFIRHAVDLQRLGATERRRAIRILKQLEDDLVAMLARGTGTPWTKARMRTLLLQVRETIGSAYDKMRAKIEGDLRKIAELEMSFAVDAVNGAIGADVATVEFDASMLKSVVGDALIEGGPQEEWWSRQARKTEQMFADTARKGVLSGSTTDQIVRDLRKNVFQNTLRRNVEALVQTGIASVVEEAHVELYEQNQDIISEVQQHSTLDSRTTLTCMAYSGKRWRLPDYEPVGHSLPFINDGGSATGCPRHWRCRSVIVPVVPMFDQLGSRMGKKDSARAERAFDRKLKGMGMSDDEVARAQMSAQASMDGYISEDASYEQWLKDQPEDVQIESLGRRRWQMWKDGKITSFSQLISQDGNPLTIAELRAKLEAA
jgi:hypothetical protein